MLVQCLKKWGLNMWCYIALYHYIAIFHGEQPQIDVQCCCFPKWSHFENMSFLSKKTHHMINRWARSSNIHPIATSWAIMSLKVDQKAITYWRNVEKRSILCPWLKHSGRKLNHRMLSFGKSMRSIWTIEYCHCSWLMRFIQSPRLNNTMT